MHASITISSAIETIHFALNAWNLISSRFENKSINNDETEEFEIIIM